MTSYADLRWTTSTPTVQEIIESQGRGDTALAGRMLHGSAALAELATGKSWAGHMSRLGVAAVDAARSSRFASFAKELDSLPAVASAWKDTAVSLADGIRNPAELSETILSAQIQTLSTTLAAASTNIPILGMVAGFVVLGFEVGRSIWLESHEAKDKQAALQLDAETDERRGNEILDVTYTGDWTDLFLPDHDPRAVATWVEHNEVEFGSGYKGGRIYLADKDGKVHGTGVGLVPGGGVATQWQYRGKQASTGSTALDRLCRALKLPIAAAKNFERYTTFGTEYFRPSMGQLSYLLWAQLTTPGPTMFRVDAAELAAQWDAYWAHWVFAFNQAATGGNETAARVTLSVIAGGTVGEFPDWPSPAWGFPVYERVPAKYRDSLAYAMVPTGREIFLPGGVKVPEMLPELQETTLGNWWVTRRGITLRYIDELRALQSRALDSIEIAYLSGSEPGLSGALASRFATRRKQLLDDLRSLRAVDMDRVPAGPWKNEAKQRRLGGIKTA